MNRTSRNTVLTLIGNGLTLVLGLGVIVGVGKQFGVGQEMDAFWAANSLPNIAGQVFLSVSLLLLSPLFIRRRAEEGDEAAWREGSTFLTGTLFMGCGIAALLWFAAPAVIRILAPGFDPGTSLLARQLLRTLALSIPPLAAVGTVSALLISNHRFALAALARPVSLLCVLAALWLGSKGLEVGTYAKAIVAGSIAAVLLIALSLWPYRRHLRLSWQWGSPAMMSLLSLLPLLLLARALDHGNQVAIRAIASALPAGAISAIGYAWTLFQVPGILGASLGTVVYPQFTEKNVQGRHGDLVHQLARCCRLILLVTCPIGVGFLCLAQPLTQLLFERGLFHHADTLLTAGVVAAFSPGVLATGLNTLIGNLYWSMGLVRARVMMEAAAIAACVVLGLLLAPVMGPAGLALATSLMYLGLVLGGLVLLQRRFLAVPQWSGLFPSLLGTLACGSAMALALVTSRFLVAKMSSSPVAILCGAGGVGLIVYLLSCRLLCKEDLSDLWNSAKGALSRRVMDSAPSIPLGAPGDEGIVETVR